LDERERAVAAREEALALVLPLLDSRLEKLYKLVEEAKARPNRPATSLLKTDPLEYLRQLYEREVIWVVVNDSLMPPERKRAILEPMFGESQQLPI
jgi:hypothetical protein